jgi:hypothetical protein
MKGPGRATLLGDAVNAGAVFALFGLHGQAHFLPEGSADKSPAAVSLPRGGFLNLGERGALCPVQQFQDRGGLTARAGALVIDFVAFEGAAFLGLVVAEGLDWATLAPFGPLGAPFFGLALFFAGGFSDATAALCAPPAAVVSLAWVFSVVIFVGFPFAVDPRQDMNHSGTLGRQADSGGYPQSPLARKLPILALNAALYEYRVVAYLGDLFST